MPSMMRILGLSSLLLGTAVQAGDSNFYLSLPLGFNSISSDDVRIIQSPPTEMEVPGGFRGGLRMGINVKGYIGFEGSIDAQGWDLFKAERGGLGFVGGGVRLHPVQVAQHWFPNLVARDWDLSFAWATGWHLLGQQADGGWGRAFEGSYQQYELAAEYYVTEGFTIGLELPWRLPTYDPHVFSNYEDNKGFCFEDRNIPIIWTDIAGRCEGKAVPTAVIMSPAISLNLRIPLSRKRGPGPRRPVAPYRED